MEEMKLPWNMPAAVCYLVQAVLYMILFGQQVFYILTVPVMVQVSMGAALTLLIQMVGMAVCAAVLYRGNRDRSTWMLLTVGVGMVTAVCVIGLFQNFVYGTFTVADSPELPAYLRRPDRFHGLCLLPNLSVIAGNIGMLSVIGAHWANRSPDVLQVCRNVWYLPGTLIAGHFVLTVLIVKLFQAMGLYWVYGVNAVNAMSFLNTGLQAAAYLLTARWIVRPDEDEYKL